MTTLKDKLANSVRQAKTTGKPAQPQPRAAERARPAPSAPAAAAQPAKRPSENAQNPASSAREIFPRRVWPD